MALREVHISADPGYWLLLRLSALPYKRAMILL
jgi:hypothetical protein